MVKSRHRRREIVVKELFLYPVKGCPALPVYSVSVGPEGLHNDRLWVLLDEAGQALNVKNAPALGRLRFALREGAVWLSAPKMPAEPLTAQSVLWFERLLGRKCQLLPSVAYASEEEQRPVSLISEQSLHSLNRCLSRPFKPLRFRPNLVVSGELTPLAETSWKAIAVPGADFDCLGGCERPHMMVGELPWSHDFAVERSARYRMTRRNAASSTGHLIFGVYMKPVRNGRINVGDRLMVSA